MEKLRDEIVIFAVRYSLEIAIALGVAAVLFIIAYPFVILIRRWWGKHGEWITFAPRRRGRRMRKQRKEFVDRDAADGFTDFIEGRVYHEIWSRQEATEVYAQLKRGFPMVRDLFPSPEYLKERIRRRLGTHTKPKLPDGKKPPRHAFDKS